MAKKQKSFADKASGRVADADVVMVKYVKSVKSEKTGFWRFNEQMIKLRDGEDLNAALTRLDEASNLVDIDLSTFEAASNEDNNSSANIDDIKESVVISDTLGEEE
tara:strand:- start:113 stop:430 length:318 start_codon:yes stop_codon:yes gene_type:complete